VTQHDVGLVATEPAVNSSRENTRTISGGTPELMPGWLVLERAEGGAPAVLQALVLVLLQDESGAR
jgi:hypothetical protein